jgi:hypothetical protein
VSGFGYLVFSPPAHGEMTWQTVSGKWMRGFLRMNFLISLRTRKAHNQSLTLSLCVTEVDDCEYHR